MPKPFQIPTVDDFDKMPPDNVWSMVRTDDLAAMLEALRAAREWMLANGQIGHVFRQVDAALSRSDDAP